VSQENSGCDAAMASDIAFELGRHCPSPCQGILHREATVRTGSDKANVAFAAVGIDSNNEYLTQIFDSDE
jgi:hypothetical protein